jgi:putative membrane protein
MATDPLAIAAPPSRAEARALILVVCGALLWSVLVAKDHMTWFMEVMWVLVAVPVLVWRWRRFPLTRLLSWLLAAHGLVLIVGGAYTYAQTPPGYWLRDGLNAIGFAVQRNPWDRVGHFMQGFVPAILARELLLRCTPLRRGGWLAYLVLASALSFSAFFELIEWWSAVAFGADADAFLATQGDPWDTQWDMFLGLVGGALGLALLGRAHDRAMARALAHQRGSADELR